MKTFSIAFGAVIAAASFASIASAAGVDTKSEEIVFAYDLERAALAATQGAARADLVREARKACTLAGVRGVMAVDEACAAELVEKVVASASAVMLDGQGFAGAEAEKPVVTAAR